MAISWLDLMAEDSNISLASSHDAEFDNSRQGVNLLFKRNVKIISDDSQSRKRTFKQMTSNDEENIDCHSQEDESENCLPPKAKQRTNAQGGWKKSKNDGEGRKTLQTENGHIGFQRFLNWSIPKSAIQGTKLNDNNRNIGNKTQTSNNLVVCAAPSMTTRPTHRRKQYRAKRRNLRKNTESQEQRDANTNDIDAAVQAASLQKAEPTKEAEEKGGEEDDEIGLRHVDEAVGNKAEAAAVFTAAPSPIETECNNQSVGVGDELSAKQRTEKTLFPPPATIPLPPQRALCVEVKTDEEEKDEDQDDALKTTIERFKESKKRRITPKLDNVILNMDLIMNKVPILKKNAGGQCGESLAGPILLNADQYVAKMKEERIEKKNKRPSIDHVEAREDEEEKEKQTKASMAVSAASMSVMSDDKQSGKAKVSAPVIPSSKATKWRKKQIILGKKTIGYENYIVKYPNKDLLFRLSHNLLATPDPKEKIGKKRWVGKYLKWRKFLHQFDSDEANRTHQMPDR